MASNLFRMKELIRHWSFAHATSSSTYPQSNGKVKAAVKSAKSVMKKFRKADPYLTLLECRNTPSQGMESSSVVQTDQNPGPYLAAAPQTSR